MYAVVEIAGKQYKVSPDDKIIVPTLKQKAGEKVTFERVLLLADEKSITVGHPLVSDVRVTGTVLDGVKGERLVVFKKKKRKGYRIKNGHHQAYSQVHITGIGK